jgi:hypothetical protein
MSWEENEENEEIDCNVLTKERETSACLPGEKNDQLRQLQSLIITREHFCTIKHCLRTSKCIPSSIRSYLYAFIAFFQNDSTELSVTFLKSTAILPHIDKDSRKKCLLLLLKWKEALLLVCEEPDGLLFRRNGELTSEFRKFLITNRCVASTSKPRNSAAFFLIRGESSREEFDERFKQFCAGADIEDNNIQYIVNDVKDEQFMSGDPFCPLFSSSPHPGSSVLYTCGKGTTGAILTIDSSCYLPANCSSRCSFVVI